MRDRQTSELHMLGPVRIVFGLRLGPSIQLESLILAQSERWRRA
jgi:hypothetical protein